MPALEKSQALDASGFAKYNELVETTVVSLGGPEYDGYGYARPQNALIHRVKGSSA